MPRGIKKMKCLGFGEYEGKCKNLAGSSHSKYWCERCDKIRLDTLNKQFADIDKQFEKMKV